MSARFFHAKSWLSKCTCIPSTSDRDAYIAANWSCGGLPHLLNAFNFLHKQLSPWLLTAFFMSTCTTSCFFPYVRIHSQTSLKQRYLPFQLIPYQVSSSILFHQWAKIYGTTFELNIPCRHELHTWTDRHCVLDPSLLVRQACSWLELAVLLHFKLKFNTKP